VRIVHGLLTKRFVVQAPTLQNVLETWATNSMIAQQKDRELFLKSHLYLQEKPGDEKREHDMDNIMEILLRLIRGDRPLIGAATDSYHHHHHHHYHHNNANNSVHPILQAAVGGDPSLIVNQTHSSLAVLAMFRIMQQTALKYGGKEVKKQVEDQVREIVKCLPPHMINKSLDGMFQKWLTSHGGSGPSKGGGATGKSHR
jgi:20S proteasome subunit alpha 6